VKIREDLESEIRPIENSPLQEKFIDFDWGNHVKMGNVFKKLKGDREKGSEKKRIPEKKEGNEVDIRVPERDEPHEQRNPDQQKTEEKERDQNPQETEIERRRAEVKKAREKMEEKMEEEVNVKKAREKMEEKLEEVKKAREKLEQDYALLDLGFAKLLEEQGTQNPPQQNVLPSQNFGLITDRDVDNGNNFHHPISSPRTVRSESAGESVYITPLSVGTSGPSDDTIHDLSDETGSANSMETIPRDRMGQQHRDDTENVQ
jgi:hypothetical protein